MTEENQVQAEEATDARAGEVGLPAPSTAADIDGDMDLKADMLVVEIDRTREALSETVQEIGDRISPDRIAQQAKETVREATVGRVEDMVETAGETARQAGGGLIETIRANPIPAAMTAVGVAWLAMRMRESDGRTNGDWSRWDDMGGTRRTGGRSYPMYGTRDFGRGDMSGTGQGLSDRIGDAAGDVQERLSGGLQGVAGSATDAMDTARARAGDIPDRMGDVAGQAGSRFEELMDESPLAVAVAALAAGAVAGLALPSTRREQELLGDTRDRLVERASDVAEQAMDKVDASLGQSGGSPDEAADNAALSPAP